LIELGEVDHSLEDVMGLLTQVETDFVKLDQVYGDPRFIEVHLRKVEVNFLILEYTGSSFLIIISLMFSKFIFRISSVYLIHGCNSQVSLKFCPANASFNIIYRKIKLMRVCDQFSRTTSILIRKKCEESYLLRALV